MIFRDHKNGATIRSPASKPAYEPPPSISITREPGNLITAPSPCPTERNVTRKSGLKNRSRIHQAASASSTSASAIAHPERQPNRHVAPGLSGAGSMLRSFVIRTASGASSQSIRNPYVTPSSSAVGVNVLNQARGQSTNDSANQLPNSSALPPKSSIAHATGSEKKLIAAAMSPLMVAPNAMIGTTTALATIPTIANWLK